MKYESTRLANKRYYQRHRERLLEYQNEYNEKHREEKRLYDKERKEKKRLYDIEYRKKLKEKMINNLLTKAKELVNYDNN